MISFKIRILFRC